MCLFVGFVTAVLLSLKLGETIHRRQESGRNITPRRRHSAVPANVTAAKAHLLASLSCVAPQTPPPPPPPQPRSPFHAPFRQIPERSASPFSGIPRLGHVCRWLSLTGSVSPPRPTPGLLLLSPPMTLWHPGFTPPLLHQASH